MLMRYIVGPWMSGLFIAAGFIGFLFAVMDFPGYQSAEFISLLTLILGIVQTQQRKVIQFHLRHEDRFLRLVNDLYKAKEAYPLLTVHQFLARRDFEFDQKHDRKPIQGPPAAP